MRLLLSKHGLKFQDNGLADEAHHHEGLQRTHKSTHDKKNNFKCLSRLESIDANL